MRIEDYGFFQQYKLIASHDKYDKRIVEYGKCRYCGDEGMINGFTQVAHAIPELLGKNNYIVEDECNKCNFTCSTYESQLADMIRPYLTMFNIETKNGIPNFESRSLKGYDSQNGNGKLYITSTGTAAEILKFEIKTFNNEDVIWDEENKRGYIKIRTRVITPLNVYKALLKIALSIMPKEDQVYHRNSYLWLINKGQQPLDDQTWGKVARIKLLKKTYTEPMVQLYRANEFINIPSKWVCPEYVLVVWVCNMSFQVNLPHSLRFQERLTELTQAGHKFSFIRVLYPSFIFDQNTEKTKYYFDDFDFSNNEKVDYEDTIPFKFENVQTIKE